jgi:hypothetical protein
MKLTPNMGTLDRALRAVAAIILLALSLTGVLTGVVGTIAIILAVVLLLTSLVSFCPLYAPFRFRTNRTSV